MIARTDVPRVKWEEPEIITPDDMAKVLWVAKSVYPEIVAALALGGFAGLRRAEIGRLQKDNIDLGQGIITLSAGITKLNQRRVVEISPTLSAWLTPFLSGGLDFGDTSYAFKVRRCVEHAKAVWPANGLRHSYISYRVQRDKDVGAIATECGHSKETLLRHYKCLCTPQMADAWFNLTPETCDFDAAGGFVEPEH